ncbi:hypothetical protein B0T24DRAFT_519353 [Lasiosphaeria ovina]|uniref:Arf-GAP domain-containing protein n=1 Tax=Lasiosphaeria ovina TaxID=92902 RepID=A0AAE0TYQ2_9PEZI|nr:hypothetical protein B0T24DRAFT_519353 [Lasiosphaeria ovina]
MSRRPPNPAAERAARNLITIKSLLKLEPNKVCADCKRNKHPRWASWNLGVFVCIRCSGIHRGMGTHISRVKSVDLDSWTDEQLQSILNWGNARANKYWEAKLAPGHVPSESKIENFIRTKYELKRWVMDGPMPDPATLDAEADDDVPLSVVKEKQNIEHREQARKASVGQTADPRLIASPPLADLIGGDPLPLRASTTSPTVTQVPLKSELAPPKATSTKDSLLGLDFMGGQPSAPPRPASTTGTPGIANQSRPDLKQSILSLYATAPRSQPPAASQQVSHVSSSSMSGMPSPTGMSQAPSSYGGLNDAFGNLSFGSPAPPKPLQKDAFAGLGSFSSPRPAPQSNNPAFSNLSGGSFFDSKPATAAHQRQQSIGNGSSFGGFTSPALTPAQSVAPKFASPPPSAALGDLFDFSTSSPPRAAAAPQPVVAPAAATTTPSVFNLSAAQRKSPPAPAAPANPLGSLSSAGSNNLSNSDIWGSNAWSAPEAPKKSPEVPKTTAASANDFGWGSSTGSFASQPIVPGAAGGFAPAPKVAADEEFGGWTSSAPVAANPAGAPKPTTGFGAASEDLFSNVWE